MDGKNIENYNAFGSNQDNNIESKNIDNNFNQNTVNVNQVWPNAQFESSSSSVNKFDYQNIENPQVIQNGFQQPVIPDIQTANINTLNQEESMDIHFKDEENNIEKNIASSMDTQPISNENIKEDIKNNKGNGYKEKSSNVLIIIIFILLALVIIFLPQISNFIK